MPHATRTAPPLRRMRRAAPIAALLGAQAVAVAAPARAAPACDVGQIRELCAAATPRRASVEVVCAIDFAALDCERAAGTPNVLTKRLRFVGERASGIVADFAGARLDAGPGTPNHRRGDIVEIVSRHVGGRWRRPEGVTLRNLALIGSVRLRGMGANAEAAAVRDSSRRPGHVRRLRGAAPRRIVLERLEIVGTGRNPVYFGPGVTDSALRDSNVKGRSERVAIYLDAESARIAIERNTIAVATPDAAVLGFYDRGWPQLAVDGSSANLIAGNRFTRLDQGGIFLYRNCGEGGTVRHSTPSDNRIVDNVFVYARPPPPRADPAVHVGSRGYGLWESLVPGSHCDDDEDARPRLGSARSNGDHAARNLVAGNRVAVPGADALGAAERRRLLGRLLRARERDVNEIGGNALTDTDDAR